MLFAFGIFRSKEINRLGKIAAVFIFLTGILMYLVGVFPTDLGDDFTLRGKIHEWVSTSGQVPVLAVGFILFAFSVVGNRKLRILTPIILVLGLGTLLLAYFLLFTQDTIPYHGILQRATIGLPYILMGIIASVLYKIQK